jgi:glycosyl transferase family 87
VTAIEAPGRTVWDRRLDLTVVAWTAVTLALLAVQPWRAIHGWYGTDWMSFATGARLLHEGAGATMYDVSAQLREQTSIIGQPPVAGLDPYPLFPLFAWVLQPLALLPPQLSSGLWSAGMAGCLLATVVVVRDMLPPEWNTAGRTMVALTTVALAPLVDSVAWGQVTPLLALLLAIAVRRAVRSGDSVLTGVLLAGVALKPQLVWLLIPLLVVVGARRTLAGFGIGAAVWAGTTLALVGPSGIHSWIFDLLPQQYAGQSVDGATVMSVLAALGLPQRAAFTVALTCAGAVVVVAWRRRTELHGHLPGLIVAGVTASAALSPHAFARDLALVGTGLALMSWHRPRVACAVAMAIGLAYLLDVSNPAWGQHLEGAVALAALASLASAARRHPESREPLEVRAALAS